MHQLLTVFLHDTLPGDPRKEGYGWVAVGVSGLSPGGGLCERAGFLCCTRMSPAVGVLTLAESPQQRPVEAQLKPSF